MKNLLHDIFVVLILAFLMTGISSCSDSMPESGTIEVSFTAEFPDDVYSRASNGELTVNTLVVGIYDAHTLEEIGNRHYFSISQMNFDITLTLAKDQEYSLVFWAYNANQSIYDINNLRAIEMKALPMFTTLVQAEYSDAFFAVKENMKVATGRNHSIKMVRPLARINIGTTGSLMQASFTAIGVPTTFCPFTKSMKGTSDFTWNYNLSSEKHFWVDDNEYNYLAMAYVFAPDSEPTQIEAKLTLKEGDSFMTIEIPEVIVQANHQTNITGNINFN